MSLATHLTVVHPITATTPDAQHHHYHHPQHFLQLPPAFLTIFSPRLASPPSPQSHHRRRRRCRHWYAAGTSRGPELPQLSSWSLYTEDNCRNGGKTAQSYPCNQERMSWSRAQLSRPCEPQGVGAAGTSHTPRPLRQEGSFTVTVWWEDFYSFPRESRRLGARPRQQHNS